MLPDKIKRIYIYIYISRSTQSLNKKDNKSPHSAPLISLNYYFFGVQMSLSSFINMSIFRKKRDLEEKKYFLFLFLACKFH